MDDAEVRDELAAAHPVLRSVAPPDAPYPGTLRRGDQGRTRLFVDLEDFGDAPSWRCDAAGHVLAPLDVARRRGGHEVVLAHCVERVDDLLARRSASGPLADGEIVTLAVSLRRGLVELLAAGGDASAEWWLTDDGRPVLACLPAADAATETTAAIVAAMRRGAGGATADALDRLADAVAHRRALTRDAEVLEAALFAAATPLPLERFATRRRSSLAELVAEPTPLDEPESSRWDDLIRGHLDSDLADLTTAAMRSVRVRFARRRGPQSPRRPPARRSGEPPLRRHRRAAPWLVAGCLGVALVSAGLVWPMSGEGATAGGAHSPAPTGATAAAAEGEVPASEGPSDHTADPPADPASSPGAAVATDDPVEIVAGIVARAAACDGDAACAAPLVEDPAGPTATRLVEVAPALVASPELVDSFGGAAVVRLAHDGASSLVVIVQVAGASGDEWLVRDVYDVADQP